MVGVKLSDKAVGVVGRFEVEASIEFASCLFDIVAIFISLWRLTLLVTYQGVFTVIRRQMAWKAWIVLVLAGLAESQRAIL